MISAAFGAASASDGRPLQNALHETGDSFPKRDHALFFLDKLTYGGADQAGRFRKDVTVNVI